MIEHINRHILEKKALHIKKGIEPISWELVVEHLQKCADGERYGGPSGILSYQLNEAETIPEVKRAMNYLNEELLLKIFDAHIFVSFTKTAQGKLHTDNHNVIIWGVSDNMKVHLYGEGEDEPFYSEEFNKGDVVYIPADMPHRIEALGARALVSFGIEVADGVKYNSPIDNPYVKVYKDDQEDTPLNG
jgi:uncharacterized RmlC-like cupin family protein